MSTINLYSHQKKAMGQLGSGSILCGGVGSGKSRTAMAYYFCKECGGVIASDGKIVKGMSTPKDLYIITTAKKRDSKDWEKECVPFLLSTHEDSCYWGVKVVVDSWNNIAKYKNVLDAFFIFDEQRVVGNGAWVKSFLTITKSNRWILLSATPGDTWTDYIPVFLANGFYKNRTEFIRRHVVYSRFAKYPKVERYIETGRLERLRDRITVTMPFKRSTERHYVDVFVDHDVETYTTISRDRWNKEENRPIRDAGEACFALRRIVNQDPSRVKAVLTILEEHPKAIIFYNYDYELEILRKACSENGIAYTEWNGHRHEPILKRSSWAYLVQYTAGAEGWNCIDTDTVIFYSLNYSYKIMEQASGRIDRMNSPFKDLYYYRLRSKSSIDNAIFSCLGKKRRFNEKVFAGKMGVA